MPILPRYLLRQFLPTFGAGLALFLGVLLMNQFLRLFTLAMMKGLPFWWILSCFMRLLPSFASLALPMAFLVATMITLAQLADSGEAMALRASGFAYFEIVRPFLWSAVVLTALLLYVNHKAGPEGFHAFRARTSEAGQKMAKIDLQPGVFVTLGPWRLFARGADSSTGSMQGVYLVRPDSSEAVRVSAERGRLALDPGRGVGLELEDGSLQLPSADPAKFTSGRFARYDVFLPLSAPGEPRESDIQEMTTSELRARAAVAGVAPDKRLEYLVEATARSAGALSPFVFFWIGAPLGLGLKRRSRGAEFAASLLVMFAFYGLFVVGVSLGRRHEELTGVAPWIADVAGLAAGAWFTRRAVAR